MKIALYILATFLETGLGIHIFAQAFPKREYMGKKQIAAEVVLISVLILVSYIFSVFFFHGKMKYIWEVLLGICFCFILCIITSRRKVQGKMKIEWGKYCFLSWSVLLLTCQYWCSYYSDLMLIVGNIFPIIFIYVFYQCSVLQAYLWEISYLASISMTKIIYITYMGIFEKRYFKEFFLYPRQHTYQEVLYWLIIELVILLLLKYIPVKFILKEIFKKYKIIVFIFTIAEWQMLRLLVNSGVGRAEKRNFVGILIMTCVGFFASSFVVLISFRKIENTEQKIFEVRNETMQHQYQELNESYERYRHLVHDEKHILCYLKECIHTGKNQEALAFIESSQKSIVDRSRSFWTGITTLDFMLNIKKRKMDTVNIEFSLDAKVSEIPMEDADFIVALGNLLDNAIEAVEQCQKENRKIWMSIQNINEMFLMTLKNTCEAQPVEKNNKFVTHKKNADRHGLGVESVRRIMEKYQGEISFEYKSGFFEVSIIITQ